MSKKQSRLKYSIPKPKGGRNNSDLILREDEFLMRKKNYFGGQNKEKEKKREKTQFEKAQRDFENGLGFDLIRSEKHKAKKLEYGYGRGNPNSRKAAKKL